jgi:hypothetical protein
MATYYVDFAAGSDSNNGTATSTPWKHSPGSIAPEAATANAAITPAAGDVIVFKGGVSYNGQITVNGTGTSSGARLTFISGPRHSSNWGTGKAIIDGQNSYKFGFLVSGKAWVDIEGFEIKNQGAPTADAAGVDYEANIPGTCDNNRVRYCTIHDINKTGGSYIIGYGIENNHGNTHIYEYNEIYNVSDKCIELYGGGGRGTNDSNAIIRYNLLHHSLVHLVVLISDSAEVYGNIMWEAHDGSYSGAPNPGYALKVDQGSSNKVYNNIIYNVSSGLGILAGDNNKFYSNIIYGVGNNTGGRHGSDDEVGFAMRDDNSHTGWTSPIFQGNDFSNNIIYYILGTDQGDDQPIFFTSTDGGDNNLIKNNIIFKTTGDTTSTANRVRRKAGVAGATSYGSIADLETNFNTYVGGSGNVASGNIVSDPTFTGGTLDSLASKPTGFIEADSITPTPNGFEIPTGSTAKDAGLTLGSPYNVAIGCPSGGSVSRPQGAAYDIGAYEFVVVTPPPVTSGDVSRLKIRRRS